MHHNFPSVVPGTGWGRITAWKGGVVLWKSVIIQLGVDMESFEASFRGKWSEEWDFEQRNDEQDALHLWD